MSSIYTGVTGLQANQKAVDVIANNVANLNTIGFKAGRVTFEDTLSSMLQPASAQGINPMQVGQGVASASIDSLMTQGDPQSTGRPLDLAIVGSGFFVANDGNANHYTRDGVMQLDANNRLVLGSNGMSILGWNADITTGNIDTTSVPPGKMTIPMGSHDALQTQNVVLGGNLNAAAATGDSYTTSYTVYDSLGTSHKVDAQFAKSDANTWSWSATSADAAAGSTPGSGTLTFDSSGHLSSGAPAVSLELANPNGATSPMNFNIDLSAVSQLDGTSTVQATSQDGLVMGTLDNFSIDNDGKIYGSFSNGASLLVGQLSLATFSNPAGLTKNGGNLWDVSSNSGIPAVHTPSVGGSIIRSGYVESSNVDLSTEFANLIVAQRGFEANSRSITTADEMLQDVLQLKR